MNLFPKLLEILTLTKIDEHRYQGESLDIGSPNVYGGQVLGQAVRAAGYTVHNDEFRLHSFHSYFLNPGNILIPIDYEVEIVKDGRSFAARRIVAKQRDKIIFVMTASYHKKEEGLEHATAMPNVAQPTSLSSFSEIFAQVAEKFNLKPRGIFSQESPIIFHPVEHYDPFNPGIRPPINHTWFKANGELTDDHKLHQTILAYASDFNLLITALFPHNMSLFTHPMQIASLDHAMWIHDDFRADDWLLYVVESSKAAGGRALCNGKIFTQNGKLVASVAQEGLIRKLG